MIYQAFYESESKQVSHPVLGDTEVPFDSWAGENVVPWSGNFVGHLHWPIPGVEMYLVRDPRDALCSLMRLEAAKQGGHFNGSEWLEVARWFDIELPALWIEAFDAWRGEGVEIVQYEQVLESPMRFLRWMEEQFDLEVREGHARMLSRLGEPVGFHAKAAGGGVGQWREGLKERDLDYIHTWIPKDHESLWMSR